MTGKFTKSNNGFSYYFEKTLNAGDEVVLKMPYTTPNKRGVCDIGYTITGEAKLYATLAAKFSSSECVWQEIFSGDDINRTVTWLKIVNNGSAPSVVNIRVIMF